MRTPGGRSNDKDSRADREALGRSRGGLSTKIVLAAGRRARPLSRIITAGHRHDSTAFTRVLSAIRSYLRRRGITATIPEPADQIKHRHRRGSRGGRPPAFDTDRYKQRNVVERCNNKLKQYRAVATRYDKREYMYTATVDVASIKIWLRGPVP